MRDVNVQMTNQSQNVMPPSTLIASPYQLLMRQSHKLGVVATKAFGNLKTILHTDLPLPSAADHFIETFKEETARKIAELKRTVKQSHEILTGAQTVSLFPDEVIVDRTKVTVIKRHSPWSMDVISIQIGDVLNVSSSIGLLFGSLTIASRVMNTTDHFDVHLFWRNDVIELKNVIQGYAIARQSGIDTAGLPRDEMLATVRELGYDSGM
jgi:hypothetical protein